MASTEQLILELNNLSSNGALKDNIEARAKALKISKQIASNLEDPVNTVTDLMYVPLVSMAAKIAIDLDLFGLICSRNKITTADLSKITGAEEHLIRFAKEEPIEVYGPTPVSEVMTRSPISSGHKLMWDLVVGAAVKVPKFLRESGYCCPQNLHDGFIQYAFQTKLNSFDYISHNPELRSDFDNFMGHAMGTRKSWVDWFPVQEILLEGFKGDSPLIVDIAGGNGHDLKAFHNRFPGRGRLVLQDVPVVIAGIQDLDASIERSPYDFFTEQPIKGARAYMFHHILHDWSDTYCVTILKNLRQAVEPGYSKLLIHDLILPDIGTTTFQGVFDLSMMIFNSGMERSGKQWTTLLDVAGFQVVKLWYPDDDGDGVIEAIAK